MTAIFKRELRSYFNSVTGYAFAAFLLLFTGIYTMGICLAGGYTNYEYVLGNMAFIFLLIVPIVTMKDFALSIFSPVSESHGLWFIPAYFTLYCVSPFLTSFPSTTA